MSSAASTTATTATVDQQLNEMILKGDILGAFEKFYAEDVVMQENLTEPFVGKEVNRKREAEFMASVEQFHSATLLSSGVNGDVTFGEWEADMTFKGGMRVKMTEVAVRRWKNGQVIHERFYYSKG
jgi:ketosteroid isomerase-like protein